MSVDLKVFSEQIMNSMSDKLQSLIADHHQPISPVKTQVQLSVRDWPFLPGVNILLHLCTLRP